MLKVRATFQEFKSDKLQECNSVMTPAPVFLATLVDVLQVRVVVQVEKNACMMEHVSVGNSLMEAGLVVLHQVKEVKVAEQLVLVLDGLIRLAEGIPALQL